VLIFVKDVQLLHANSVLSIRKESESTLLIKAKYSVIKYISRLL